MSARVLFVTGTDTGVGKTVATAALAAAFSARSAVNAVAVYKPVQTGVGPGDPGDVDEVRRLSGVRTVSEGIRLPDPMAPVAAAGRAGVELPPMQAHRDRIEQLMVASRHVIVEGAGGVLVRLDAAGRTLADLAAECDDAAAVVVCRSGLGTQNHTELTLEALDRRSVRVAGVVIGAWPRHPDAVERGNAAFLASLGVPLLGCIPEGAATLRSPGFRARAQAWFTTWPPADWRAGHPFDIITD